MKLAVLSIALVLSLSAHADTTSFLTQCHSSYPNEIGFCQGFITAQIEDSQDSGAQGVCPGRAVPETQIVSTVIDFMQVLSGADTRVAQRSAGATVRAALRFLYPCSDTAQPLLQ